MRVLVTAASRHDATHEIAEAIGAALGERGLEVTVAPVESAPDPGAYDAVVLGSAVYVGHWLEAARTFAGEHAEALRGRPLWLFSSGPADGPPQLEEEAEEAVTLAGFLGARGHRTFSGRLEKRRLGLVEKAVVKLLGAAEGDYRAWDEIEAWTAEIATSLGSE